MKKRANFEKIADRHGFTLLEVMVAVAILAIALVSLLGTQTQSLSFLTDSRFQTVAAMLAQQKMTEISLRPFDEIANDSGEFTGEFSQYRWEIEVNTLMENDTGLTGIDNLLKSVNLKVGQDGDSLNSLSLQKILFDTSVTGETGQ